MRSSLVVALMFLGVLPLAAQSPTLADYPSIQAAIDANPGASIFLPAGDYPVEEKIRLKIGGLHGEGRIVQKNDAAPALEIHDAAQVTIRGITVMRPADTRLARAPLVDVRNSTDVTLDDVRVMNNKSRDGAISFANCVRSSVRDCMIENYKCIAVDDRTGSELYGYAFRAIDGTGILLNNCRHMQIVNNRVTDYMLLPTEAVKTEHDLGRLTDGRNPEKRGRLAPKGDYVNNWHQGSAIVVTGPTKSAFVTIRGNQIENAAQGVDIHADYVTCSENQIDKCLIGLKVLHGSKHVTLASNIIAGADLWGLVMQPGTSSWDADENRPANVTAGNIVANNTFTDFGRGNEWYNWKGDSTAAMFFDAGPLEHNPPMAHVLVTGNLVYNSESESLDEAKREPRYAYALRISGDGAQEIVARDNSLSPGFRGVANVELHDDAE